MSRPDDIQLILEAKATLKKDPFARECHLLGGINRFRYDMRIYPVYPECWSYPYVGTSTSLSCLPKTLLCSHISADLMTNGKWRYTFQLTYRPVAPYVWDFQYLKKAVPIYPCIKFSYWLPNGLVWKIK